MTIKIETTRSSMLNSIAYDEAEKILQVEFSNGGTYNYLDVPKEVFDNLLSAETSIGKYFIANVRGKYESEKL